MSRRPRRVRVDEPPQVDPGIYVFESPKDRNEKEAWAKQMARVQYAMWVNDKAKCAECGQPYASVDDFIARNPKVGWGKFKDWDDTFVDQECWDDYVKRKGEPR